jgi:hypothetical protein
VEKVERLPDRMSVSGTTRPPGHRAAPQPPPASLLSSFYLVTTLSRRAAFLVWAVQDDAVSSTRCSIAVSSVAIVFITFA